MIWLTIITANANISLQYILQKAKIVSIRTRFLLFSYTRDIGASGSHLGVCVHSFANLSSSGYCTSRTQQIRKHNNLFVKWFRRNHGPFSTVQNTCVVFANLDVLLVRCLCVTSFEASFLTRFSMHLFQSTSSFVLAIFLLAKIIKCAMQLALAPCFRSPPLYSMGKWKQQVSVCIAMRRVRRCLSQLESLFCLVRNASVAFAQMSSVVCSDNSWLQEAQHSFATQPLFWTSRDGSKKFEHSMFRLLTTENGTGVAPSSVLWGKLALHTHFQVFRQLHMFGTIQIWWVDDNTLQLMCLRVFHKWVHKLSLCWATGGQFKWLLCQSGNEKISQQKPAWPVEPFLWETKARTLGSSLKSRLAKSVCFSSSPTLHMSTHLVSRFCVHQWSTKTFTKNTTSLISTHSNVHQTGSRFRLHMMPGFARCSVWDKLFAETPK